MSRYVARPPVAVTPSADWSDDYPLIPQISVDDGKDADTGLTDLAGNPIYRLRNPVGFGRDTEW